jgi:hypothetical protein
LLAGFLLLSVVGVSYACSVISLGYPYAYTYMPSGLVESCVDFSDISDVKKAFLWVNEHVPVGAVVIVPEKFQGFALMYSRNDIRIRVAPPLISLSDVLRVNKTYGLVYAIYYINEIENCMNINILERFGSIAVCSILIG